MKRRSLLRSIVTIPALIANPAATEAQQDRTAARHNGLPAGPPLIPPGSGEMPNVPVTLADETADNVLRTFNPDRMAALTRLGEIIVPSWAGNPGAREAGAAAFLDFLVGCSPPSRIELYQNGLDTLNQRSQEKFSKPFALVSAEQADGLLAPLRQPWTYQKANENDFHAFLLAAKGDLLRATVNSKPYIDTASRTHSMRNDSDFYWRIID